MMVHYNGLRVFFIKNRIIEIYWTHTPYPANDPAYANSLLLVFGDVQALKMDALGTYEQFAGFGELSYDLLEKLTVTAGGRYFKEYRDATTIAKGYFVTALEMEVGSFSTEDESTVFNPKLQLRYKFNDDLMSYATYSKGFRSGGQNVFTNPAYRTFYDP